MNEIKVDLVIYYLQTRTRSFKEALKMAKRFLGEDYESQENTKSKLPANTEHDKESKVKIQQ